MILSKTQHRGLFKAPKIAGLCFLSTSLLVNILIPQKLWAAKNKDAKGTDEHEILATINGKNISVEEFNIRYQIAMQKNLGLVPDRKSVLQDLIYFELAVQEAKKNKLDEDPVVKNQFEALLYQALMRQKLQRKVDGLKVEDSEIKAYYERNPLLRTSHIVFLVKPDMDAQKINDQKVKAMQILQQLKAGKLGFSEMVKKYSEGPEVSQDGDLGYGAAHKLLPEYYEAALKIKDINGIYPELVYTIYGFHIIKLTGKKPFKDITPEYRLFVENILKEEKGKGLYLDYFKQLEAANKVSINDKILQKLNTSEEKK